MIRIHAYRPDDSDETVRMWRASRRKAFPYVPLHQAHSEDDDRRFWQQKLLVEYDLWLASDEERIVGMLAIKGSDVDQLFVAVDRWRSGVGTLLLEHAKGLSPAGLELFTFRKNTTARAFYERHGFRAVRFGKSPAPENEPDVEYHWRPGG